MFGREVMTTDDEDFFVQDARARKFAGKKWQGARKRASAPKRPEDLDAVDSLIRTYREREMEAAVNRRFSDARRWLVAADTLSLRQKFNDEALLNAMEDLGLVDGVWPEGYEQIFE